MRWSERVRAAFASIGLAIPAGRLIVNLAPADLPKEGTHYDLPIALAMMAAIGALPHDALDGVVCFGELGLDGELVRRFREKPQITDGWINGGFFVFEKKAFDLIDDRENFSLEEGLLERLADSGEVAVFRHQGFWQCMDTYREMQLLNTMWEDGRAPWKTWWVSCHSAGARSGSR